MPSMHDSRQRHIQLYRHYQSIGVVPYSKEQMPIKNFLVSGGSNLHSIHSIWRCQSCITRTASDHSMHGVGCDASPQWYIAMKAMKSSDGGVFVQACLLR